MIYFFYGSDTEKIRAKAFAWVSATRLKAPDASYVRLGVDEIRDANLISIAGTQGLFFSKTLALIDDPFAKKDTGETLFSHLEMLAESPNPIAILAPSIHSAHAKKIEAKAVKTFSLQKSEKTAKGFNAGLTNALSSGKSVLLWTELTKAFRAGDAPEMLHGLLHWKARELMQKGSMRGRILSRELIELLSSSRTGKLPLKEALERFALTLS